MPVIQCTCGKQLRVPDEHAGKRVKCPGCGQPVVVPAARAVSTAPPAAVTKINFRCGCGQAMQAKPEHAGLRSKCPACGTVVAIPRPGAAADKMTPRAPQAVPPPAPSREEPEPAPRPRREAPAAKGSPLPWIVGIVVLLVLVGGGIGAFFIFKDKDKGDVAGGTGTGSGTGSGTGGGQTNTQAPGAIQDVDLVPGDAQGFAMLRVADLWNADLTQKVLKEVLKSAPPGTDPLAEMQKNIGLTPADVERITAVAVDAEQKMGWAVVTSTRPLEPEQLLFTWFKGNKAEKVTHAGKTLHVVPTPDLGRLALCFVHDTLLVAGPEEGVKRCLNQIGGQRSAGPLDEAIKRAGEKHLVLLAGTPPPDIMAQARMNLPDFLQSAAPLLDAQGASLTLDLPDLLKLELGLRMPNEEKAKAAAQAAQDLVSAGRIFLPQVKTELSKELPKETADALFKQIQATSNSIKVNSAGPGVTVQVSADVKAIGDILLPLLPGLLGGGASGPGPVGAAKATQHSNNLKQLVLAMHNYHDANGHFPPAVIYSKDGKPLYSWRVELLPYLEQGQLYNEFHRDEPWNSPHNIKLVSRMPPMFRLPGDPPTMSMTPYQVFVGQGTPWPGDGRMGLRMPGSFPDGTSNTILIAEASKKVLWTQPEDMRLRPGVSPLTLVGSRAFPGFFYVALADGFVTKVPTTISEKTLRDAINPADGNPLGPDWPVK